MPYTSVGGHPPPISWTRAACSGSSCILETNIRLLPDAVSHTSDSIEHMLSVGEKNFEVLGEAGKQHYQEHPPSHAVDTHADTFFQSPDGTSKCFVWTFPSLEIYPPIRCQEGRYCFDRCPCGCQQRTRMEHNRNGLARGPEH